MNQSNPGIIIVGAGLAGLCCALTLQEVGFEARILEAGDAPGGRVRTDVQDGFLLDRGFQVLLTAYPEARARLDYEALELRPFYPGALVRLGGRFHRLADPFKHPIDALVSLASPVGTLADKLRVGTFRRSVGRGPLSELLTRKETTALKRLLDHGFSSSMIDRFFRPFFGGVFLDRELGTSSRILEFLFRTFGEGEACLPARGMGRIARQLVQRLGTHSIQCNREVSAVEPGRVDLSGGGQIAARAVVVACQGPRAARLLDEIPPVASRSVKCVYFAARQAPLSEPILVLDGEGSGPVNNFSVVSQVAPGYAPPGFSLLSASVLGSRDEGPALIQAVVEQLSGWFGDQVHHWEHLKTYRIDHALPQQDPPFSLSRSEMLRPGLFVCGDYRDVASIHGAMLSGRRAAEGVIEYLRSSG